MKALVIEGSERKNADTGLVTHYVRVLAEFMEFGEIKKSTVDIKVPDSATQSKILENVNKFVELDVILPKPNYPLELRA